MRRVRSASERGKRVVVTKSTTGTVHGLGVRAPSIVSRPSLFALLSSAADGGVTLLSAPAGSGKTVLLRSWLAETGLAQRAAWVSVDRGERDARRFWMSVVESLRGVEGLDSIVQNLAASPDFDEAALVQRLIGELGSLESPLIAVIDDVHELQSSTALAQLELLLARRPALLGVMLASRHDPRLGLHRLRLAGELTELRMADLRFTPEEASEFLARSGIALATESVALLHARTEGWAAGLRLAAISLARHPDPERFVAEFAGSERAVADYLMAEVLEYQPDEVRRLLLRTSILERVNGALADVLVGATGSERILQTLEAGNAFVVSLDAARTWFRYHHLFADLLRLELRRTEPEALAPLHHRAAEWYAHHGYAVDGVRHAQAAEDWCYAAQLLVDASLTLWLNGQLATLQRLISALPPDAPSNPELALLFGCREMIEGSLDAAAAYMALADRHAADVAEGRKARFDIVLAVMRLTLARRRADFGTVLENVDALLGHADAETLADVGLTNEARAAALMNLGIVELWAFRLSDAGRHLEQGLELARRIGLPYVQVGCLSHLAVLNAWVSFDAVRQGCAQALALAEDRGLSNDPVVSPALAMMALMDVAQGRFQTAHVWLARAEATLRPDLEPATALLLQRALGMLQFSEGHFEEALASFRAAERLQTLLVTPHSLSAQNREFLALTLLRLGRTEDARDTVAALSHEERQWGEARTALASLLLAESEPRGALEAIEPVAAGALSTLHSGSRIEALLVRAVARDQLGDARGAEADVERALELAEPDVQCFPFLLIRPTQLLERHPHQRTAHAALLANILDVLAGSVLPPRDAAVGPIREELSQAELRVLGFLAGNLSAPEIAAELYVSTSTVKTHMRQIYAKLDVHKRTEAVERARELGLLGRSSRQH